MFNRKQIISLLIPIFAEQFFGILVGMADTMMVSSVGEAAVSGVSLVDSVNLIIFSLLSSLAAGGSIICSQQIGAKNPTAANKSANQLCMVCAMLGVLLMALCIIGSKWILKIIFGSVEADVMENAVTYFIITAFSIPFMSVINAGGAIMRAEGNSKVSFQASLVVNIINILGNALCIFVLKMGVAGVALPTLVSRIVGAVLVINIIKNPKHILCVPSLFKVKPDLTEAKNILKIGIPTGIENSIFHIGKVILQSLVSTLGTASIAAMSVANSIAGIHYLFGSSIGIALITIVGQCVGAKKYREAKKYTISLIAVNYICLAIVCTLTVLFADNIVSLYSLEGTSRQIAISMITLHSFAMSVWPFAFTIAHPLRAANQVKFTMWVSLISMFVFRIGFSYIFVYFFKTGVEGVWYAMYIDWIARVLLFPRHFFFGKWQKQSGEISRKA